MRSSSSSSARRMVIGRAASDSCKLFLRMFDWESHDEGRSLSRCTARDDVAVVAHRYFATDRQSNACSFVSLTSVQAFKHRENAVGVLFVEADSVVFDDDLGAMVVVVDG